MSLKHPEYAHGISDGDLIKEALEFCDEELDGYDGMEYNDECEVACQRSNTFIRELVRRLEKSRDDAIMRKTLEWIEDYALAFADLEEVSKRAGMALRSHCLETGKFSSSAQVLEVADLKHVPKEPTQEMLERGADSCCSLTVHGARGVYLSMLSASPDLKHEVE